MEKSESIKNITIALLNFQKLVGKIPKDSNNPFFKSKYAALPDILDKTHQPLIDCGLIVSQWPCGLHSLTTLVAHESGEYIMETYQMTPAKNDPQGIGSSITYQRRYAIGAVLNLNIDIDDDGNGASGLNTTPKVPAQPAAPVVPVDYAQELRNANTLTSLGNVWNAIPAEHKPAHLATKDEMKDILTVVEQLGQIKTLLKLDAYIAEFEKGEHKDNAKLRALIEKRKLDLIPKS